MSLLAFVLPLYLAVALAIDAAAVPGGRMRDRPVWALALGAAALLLPFAAWLVLSWRPVFAGIAALAMVAIVVAISRAKSADLHEPLSFIDFVFVPQIWRHPRLYHVELIRHPLSAVGAAALLCACIGWWSLLEPPMLEGWTLLAATVGGVAAIAGLLAWLLEGPLPARWGVALRQRLRIFEQSDEVRSFGLAATLLGSLVVWRRRTPPGERPTAWPDVVVPASPAPIVIAVQSESFVDLAAAGMLAPQLAELRSLRERAFSWGRLDVAVQGAWTLRSEISFLTGQPVHALGHDALHPYLRVRASTRTLAHRLGAAGFDTVFVHPFDLRFFGRDRALPRLGFRRLVGEEAFPADRREGYYVSDDALAERLLAEAAQHAGPIFLMAVTMENHHPWRPGRLAGVDRPIDQYIHHLRNADRMVGTLVRGLERLGRPAVLTFYGDHIPMIGEIAAGLPDTRTDYLVASLCGAARLHGRRRDLAIHQLADTTLDALAAFAAAPAALRRQA